jgi:hypothetical protein
MPRRDKTQSTSLSATYIGEEGSRSRLRKDCNGILEAEHGTNFSLVAENYEADLHTAYPTVTLSRSSARQLV